MVHFHRKCINLIKTFKKLYNILLRNILKQLLNLHCAVAATGQFQWICGQISTLNFLISLKSYILHSTNVVKLLQCALCRAFLNYYVTQLFCYCNSIFLLTKHVPLNYTIPYFQSIFIYS